MPLPPVACQATETILVPGQTISKQGLPFGSQNQNNKDDDDIPLLRRFSGAKHANECKVH